MKISLKTMTLLICGLVSLCACDEVDPVDGKDLYASIDMVDHSTMISLDMLAESRLDALTDHRLDFQLDQSLILPDSSVSDVDQGVTEIFDAGGQIDFDIEVDMEADMQIAIPSPLLPPTLDQVDTVIDLAVPGQRIWAYVISVTQNSDGHQFISRDYTPTENQIDFWPASTIKMYTATAALELLNQEGFSIDAVLTFHRLINGEWVEEISMSLREIVRRTFGCSSNETYTLLLRFAGIDWLNREFFTPRNGFQSTALMRDYVSDDARPWRYNLQESQRITISEGVRESSREHQWSGRSYADEVGCTVYNGAGTANCTSAHDMAEHMRRVIFQEYLPLTERFEINASTLNWYRGASGEAILNNTGGEDCGGPVYAGILNVFDQPILHHKEGLVTEYRGTMHHVYDERSRTEYIAAVMIDSPQETMLKKLSEELARMMKTPRSYVHLDSLRDYVNPVRARLVTYSEEPGLLQMMIKPYTEDGYSDEGWTPLAGASIAVEFGEHSHELRSTCLNQSRQVHIRGRLETDSGVVSWSDLHYVIIDHEQACED
jgi:hypothetical protein